MDAGKHIRFVFMSIFHGLDDIFVDAEGDDLTVLISWRGHALRYINMPTVADQQFYEFVPGHDIPELESSKICFPVLIC